MDISTGGLVEINKIIRRVVAQNLDKSAGEIVQEVEKKLSDYGYDCTKELELYKFIQKILKEFNPD